MCQNSISAGAPPQTPLWELQTSAPLAPHRPPKYHYSPNTGAARIHTVWQLGCFGGLKGHRDRLNV